MPKSYNITRKVFCIFSFERDLHLLDTEAMAERPELSRYHFLGPGVTLVTSKHQRLHSFSNFKFLLGSVPLLTWYIIENMIFFCSCTHEIFCVFSYTLYSTYRSPSEKLNLHKMNMTSKNTTENAFIRQRPHSLIHNYLLH